MNSLRPWFRSLPAVVALGLTAGMQAQNLLNVLETGGDNEPTDTITAKWTGQTFPISVNNEPFPGAVIGNTYTVGTFGSGAPAFVDRNHRFLSDPAGIAVPAYLAGLEYVMSGNDNRDNASYRLDLTLATPSVMYLLIDNRLSDGDALTPPTFGAAAMQWVVDQGWTPTANGLNRSNDPTRPDEVAFDEGADNTINQFYSVYSKTVPAGTASLLQADNAGRNMYTVVVASVPEPGTVALGVLGAAGLLFFARRR
ncbi:MAG: PEP-CTERM sorting domain-containing protein [Verrucomicrobiota bacterium]